MVGQAARGRPQEIAAVHAAYFCAGATIATTASYQASLEGFATGGEEIVAAGVTCCAPTDVLPAIEAAAAVGKPAIAYPNSGEHWDALRHKWR